MTSKERKRRARLREWVAMEDRLSQRRLRALRFRRKRGGHPAQSAARGLFIFRILKAKSAYGKNLFGRGSALPDHIF